jgi:UPF0755 protein
MMSSEHYQRAKNLVLRIGLAAILSLVLFGAYRLFDMLYGRNEFPDGASKRFLVSRGQTFAAVADSLEAAGIIRDRPYFVFAAKLFGGSDRIKVGKYEFPSGISNVDIFLALREGKNALLISVALPEGFRARAYAAILSHSLGIDSARYMELVNNERFTRSLGIGRSSLEGYLLPQTYTFWWQQDEESVIREQVHEFRLVYNDSLDARARELRMSMNDVVTLASIVEGEAVVGVERARIAGVYHNRLKKGMKLQADPTIQYFIEDGPRRVTYSDLKINNPYNTYIRAGLPPGPVNNPGKASIIAALFPEKNSYLYFVANGKGGHWFSASYEEHQKYVRKYRKGRAQRVAQSWGGGI